MTNVEMLKKKVESLSEERAAYVVDLVKLLSKGFYQDTGKLFRFLAKYENYSDPLKDLCEHLLLVWWEGSKITAQFKDYKDVKKFRKVFEENFL